MNSVYLAAQYKRREEIAEYAAQLRSMKVQVTSTWLTETWSPSIQMKEVPERELRNIALQDIRDIDEADSFIFFAEDQNQQPPRGGRHVEFGYALAKGKQMFVIGAKENIFHHLPWVSVHKDWLSFLDCLMQNGAHQ
jgi:nucleoside 2-deoxyribosyltransferase